LEIKPVMLPFFTLFEVDEKHHTLKPYIELELGSLKLKDFSD
jgi:hypothetical protein